MSIKISIKRRPHEIIVLTLALTLAVFVAACSKTSNTSNSSNSTNSNMASSNSASSSNSANSATNTSSTSNPADMSPTETMKAYFDAAKRKDIETVKRLLSHGTMLLMEVVAKEKGKTVDQMFKENSARDSQMPIPEFSNEKINGDTATIDIKAPEKPLVTMQMVKEDGEWKLAIDKMMKGGGEHGSH